MPVETRIAFFKPDSLAIVTNEFNPKLEQGRHGDLIRNDWNLIQLKVPIGHRQMLSKEKPRHRGPLIREDSDEEANRSDFRDS